MDSDQTQGDSVNLVVPHCGAPNIAKVGVTHYTLEPVAPEGSEGDAGNHGACAEDPGATRRLR